MNKTHCVSSPQALHLVGSGSWSANAYHPVDLSVKSSSGVTLTAKVLIEQMVSGGCTPILAYVGLDNPNVGSWGTTYGTIRFHSDGNIYAMQNEDGNSNVKLMKYEAKTWYTLRTDIDLTKRVFDVYINGVLKASGLKIMNDGLPTGVELSATHGNAPSAWFDDVVVSSAMSTQPRR